MNDYNNQNPTGAPINPYNYEKTEQNVSHTPAPEFNAQQTYQQPYAYDYGRAPVEPKKEVSRGQAIKAFIFGIVALECCGAPFISIISIIFGAIAKNNGAKLLLEAPTGATRVFATLGKIFGLIGFIIGIIMTALSPFWLIGFISGLIDSLEFSLFL